MHMDVLEVGFRGTNPRSVFVHGGGRSSLVEKAG